MPHIEELLNACIAVLVRYHEVKETKRGKPAPTLPLSDRVKLIADKPDPDMLLELRSLITVATEQYKSRSPMFEYLLHNITLLSPFVKAKLPYPDIDILALKSQFTQFIVDIQSLLGKSDSEQLTFNYAQNDPSNEKQTVETIVQLFGFVRGLISSYVQWGSLTDSGTIFQEELFTTLLPKDKLGTVVEPGDIEKIIGEIVDTHQTKLIDTQTKLKVPVLEQKLKQVQDRNTVLEAELTRIRQAERDKTAAQALIRRRAPKVPISGQPHSDLAPDTPEEESYCFPPKRVLQPRKQEGWLSHFWHSLTHSENDNEQGHVHVKDV